MPAACPAICTEAAELVYAWGNKLRELRTRLHLSARAAAEAAGISRVTLHRIERGNPSVTVGAYAAVEAALRAYEAETVGAVDVSQYPQLRRLAWNLAGGVGLTSQEALSLYERNWRHLDHDALTPQESAFIDHLVSTVGNGTLLV